MKIRQSSNNTDDKHFNLNDQYLVTVEIEDFLKVKDALLRAIDGFNSCNFKNEQQFLPDFKITKEIERYSVKIAKKSGKANFDLPQLGLDNILKDLKVEKLAVIIEDFHVFNLDNSQMINNSLRINKSSGSSVDREETFMQVKQKKKCCGFCTIY